MPGKLIHKHENETSPEVRNECNRIIKIIGKVLIIAPEDSFEQTEKPV